MIEDLKVFIVSICNCEWFYNIYNEDESEKLNNNEETLPLYFKKTPQTISRSITKKCSLEYKKSNSKSVDLYNRHLNKIVGSEKTSSLPIKIKPPIDLTEMDFDIFKNFSPIKSNSHISSDSPIADVDIIDNSVSTTPSPIFALSPVSRLTPDKNKDIVHNMDTSDSDESINTESPIIIQIDNIENNKKKTNEWVFVSE